jgi:mediator of replication checkpoint protein 1
MDLTDTLWIDSKDEEDKEDHIRVKAVKFNKRMAGVSIIGATELDDGLEVSSGSCSIVPELIYFKVPICRFQI